MPPQQNDFDYRPWETKLLEILSDGKTHYRVELETKVFPLIDPFQALRHYRKKHKTTLVGGARIRDRGLTAAEAQVESARREIFTRMISHMQPTHGSRGLIYSTGTDTKGRSDLFTITESGLAYLEKGDKKKPLLLDVEDPASPDYDQKIEPLEGEPIYCAVCEEPLDPTEVGIWIQSIGWRQTRRSGGPNKFSRYGLPLAYTHRQCFD